MSFQFDSLSAFLHMEGHGVYVWTGFVVCFAVMVWLVLRPLIGRGHVLRQLKRDIKRREAQLEGGEG